MSPEIYKEFLNVLDKKLLDKSKLMESLVKEFLEKNKL